MRYIEDKFLIELKLGKYAPVLSSVLKDDTLDLELRGDSIVVYYRGGKLFSLMDGNDYVVFNSDYGRETDTEVDVKDIEKEIPLFKYAIDLYLCGLSFSEGQKTKMEYEGEFQQLVIRSNNYTKFSNVSKGTDFYIADSEYDTNGIGRYDLVGFRFHGSSRSYKLQKLTLIEMKYGMNSIRGKQGIRQHLSDFHKMYDDKDRLAALSKEMMKVLQQKYYLGLVPGLKASSSDTLMEKIKAPSCMEAVFALGDFNKDSKRLRKELTSINPADYPFDVFFARSPFLGYGLYEQSLIPLRALKEQIEKDNS